MMKRFVLNLVILLVSCFYSFKADQINTKLSEIVSSLNSYAMS